MERKRRINRKTKINRKRKRQMRRRLVLSGMSAVFLLLAVYIGFSIYYSKHFYRNTIINGVDCSNLTVEQAKLKISDKVNTYALTLKGRDELTGEITGEDIGLEFLFGDYIEQMKANQKGPAWPAHHVEKNEYDMDVMLAYDEQKLKSRYEQLVFFDSEHERKPVDAYISEYENGGYTIIKEDPGSLIRKEKLFGLIEESIHQLENVINLEETGCYKEPELTANSQVLQNALSTLNTYAGAEITYEFGEDKEVVDGDRISRWITVGEDFEVTLEGEKVKEFVDYIGKHYNSFGKTRSFKTSYNKTLEMKGGDYGWWLNRSAEQEELTALIKAGEKTVKEPNYYQKAQQYGEDDIGDTYVEINITAQHIFFYKEGKLVVESDFVSGNISRDYGTPSGVYPIVYKDRNSVLVGETYETPVDYWMPFNGNIGMHDAPWRKEFGKDIYLKNGSHGCINLPPSVAQTIWENISKGTAVIVYELPGTENYEVTEDHLNVFEEARKRAEKKAEEEAKKTKEGTP